MSGTTFVLNTTTPSPSPTTERPTDDERIKTMTKLMKEDEEVITQFYPDYEYEEDKEVEEVKTTKSRVIVSVELLSKS